MMVQIKGIIRKMRGLWKLLRFHVSYRCAHEKVNIPSEGARAYLCQVAPAPDSTAFTHNQIGPKDYDLTIIIPAYNAEKWIKQCLDSILTQETKYTYLVKVVNDGSKDQTPALIEQYRGDAHVQIIHQENRGYSGARNAALKHLPSEYVMFVDSDDYLLPGAIELLLEKGYGENADIVEGNGFRFDENGRIGKIKEQNKALWGGPCLKIIRSELFECLEFPEGYLYEDTIIRSLIVPLAKRIAVIPDEIYAYRIHMDSITWKRTAELNRTHSYWIMEMMHDHMRQLSIPFDHDQYCLTMKHIVFTYRRTILLSEEIKRSIFAATCGFVEKYYPEYLAGKDCYSILATALVNRDYRKYKACCEADLWWDGE
ncbi:MAG: glycosyltransferase family 2 protein [Clostridia bacterium]|nr:glycosyltransferase family 2 protein [Clostridia bacterium]